MLTTKGAVVCVLLAVAAAVIFYPRTGGKPDAPFQRPLSPLEKKAVEFSSRGVVSIVSRGRSPGIFYDNGINGLWSKIYPGTAIGPNTIVVERVATIGAGEIFVHYQDGRRINAIPEWESLSEGIAVLKTEEKLLSWVPLASESSYYGELVAVSSGHGEKQVSSGEIYGINESYGTMDVSIGEGEGAPNYNGSPVFDSDGKVVSFLVGSVFSCIGADSSRGGTAFETGKRCRRAITARNFCDNYKKCAGMAPAPLGEKHYVRAGN